MGYSFYNTVFAIYDFIEQYLAESNRVPTVKEIASAVDVGSATASRCLTKMEKMGMIERQRNRVRAIKLVSREANWNALVEPEPDELPPMLSINRKPLDRARSLPVKAYRLNHHQRRLEHTQRAQSNQRQDRKGNGDDRPTR